MKWVLFVVLLLLGGCPTTAIQGTYIWGQVDYTLNTTQKCLRSPRIVQLADRALVALAAAAVEKGYRARVAEVYERVDSPSKPGVCLVQTPEACRIGSICAMGSTGRDCLPRAGCGAESWMWVSVEWPAGTVRDWCGDVLHEMGHVVAARLWVPDSPDHKTKWAEVEALATKNYSCAAIGEIP